MSYMQETDKTVINICLISLEVRQLVLREATQSECSLLEADLHDPDAGERSNRLGRLEVGDNIDNMTILSESRRMTEMKWRERWVK